MKYIVGISVIATLGALILYQGQNTVETEMKNSNTAILNVEVDEQEELVDKKQNNIIADDSANEIVKIEPELNLEKKIKGQNIKNKVVKKQNINNKQAVQAKNSLAATMAKTDKVSTVQSASTNQTELTLKKEETEKEKKKVTQILDVSFNTDTKETTDGEKGYDSQLWYFLYYKINSEYTARLWAIINKDLADSYEEKLGDTRVTFSKKSLALSEKLKLSPSISTVIPTSEKSKRNEELNIGLELNASLGYALTDDLSVSYLPRIVKNFHEYETSRTNKTNTEYKIVQFYSANYSISEKWSFAPTLIYTTTWSYSGRRRNPSYTSILELAYSVNDNVSLAMGTIQGGSVFDRENGPNESIELYDENESTIYGNFNLKF